eukprot:scaffold29175_cov69-Attheya_sp.AAC.1
MVAAHRIPTIQHGIRDEPPADVRARMRGNTKASKQARQNRSQINNNNEATVAVAAPAVLPT